MRIETLGRLLFVFLVGIFLFFVIHFLYAHFYENKTLKEIITRLEADRRVAEVLVTGVNFDENTGKVFTTIKFLEYDIYGRPVSPKYFTFSGNVIQFQSLVIRFSDIHIQSGDRLRGKSAYIFWKVFMLSGANTEEYEITKTYSVPEGYKTSRAKNRFEEKLWKKFWDYALNSNKAKQEGIKNAQIEAPGTMFIPGVLYIIKIENDGGLRIDASKLPEILKGERILNNF